MLVFPGGEIPVGSHVDFGMAIRKTVGPIPTTIGTWLGLFFADHDDLPIIGATNKITHGTLVGQFEGVRQRAKIRRRIRYGV